MIVAYNASAGKIMLICRMNSLGGYTGGGRYGYGC